MDSGQLIFIVSRLFLGALASFFAIMLWAKIRDIPWMLMVIGTIAAYAETVYSILNTLGITDGFETKIGSVPVAAIVLPNLPTIFYSMAFLVMIIKKSRHR
ncbi:hypothetical protein [Gracilinema caldarium]|uniref:Uncharacterized protein n=1 Tax=Gracilinema caldarium (strain ATCC 51460 / DSM 7334 / H1) TaxID=744872 RepID=F8EYQ2_GRAC1|nr:hypothetical protein [Gracilinema caldarium]AEJ18629.1 hypothetical protein Spica_0465 [Gracilinema caldarium DSM 7334]